jgi:hypothetical protein
MRVLGIKGGLVECGFQVHLLDLQFLILTLEKCNTNYFHLKIPI